MKTRSLLALALTLVFSLQLSPLFASETKFQIVDNAPVIGEFVPDEVYSETIERKEALAEQYYEAKISGATNRAEELLKEFAAFGDNKTNEVDASGTRASAKRIAGIVQIPQDNNYYCGYAAIKSLLNYHSIYKTQYQIASDVYYTDEPCPWYLDHGNDRSQFPVPIYLTQQIGFFYVPYPYGAAGTNQLEGYHVSPKVISIIDSNHGLVCCGASWPGGLSYLPNYPTNQIIVHWLAIDGYKDSGNTIWIVDPVANAGVPGFLNVQRYYSITSTKFANFAEDRGLVW